MVLATVKSLHSAVAYRTGTYEAVRSEAAVRNAVLTMGRAYWRWGQQSAHGPGAAATWGKKQLSVAGMSTV